MTEKEIQPKQYKWDADFIGKSWPELGSRLTVVKVVQEPGKPHRSWLCSCECGGEIIALKRNLETGRTRSCGCLFEEYRNSERMRKNLRKANKKRREQRATDKKQKEQNK